MAYSIYMSQFSVCFTAQQQNQYGKQGFLHHTTTSEPNKIVKGFRTFVVCSKRYITLKVCKLL